MMSRMRVQNYIRYTLLTVAAALCAFSASGQHYLGVRGGFGSGDSRLYPKRETKMVGGLMTAGLSWKYYSPERVLGGVEVDLLFIQQGFQYEPMRGEYYGNYKTYQRTYNSVMMPIFWQPHVYFSRQRLRVFLNAGVTFSYIMDAKYKGTMEDGTTDSGTHKMYYTEDNHWGYGLCAGGGFGWAFGDWEVVAEFRYYIGYSDAARNINKNPDGKLRFLRTPLDKMEGNIGVYYRLGKTGILAKPGARTQKKIDEWQARNAATPKPVKAKKGEQVPEDALREQLPDEGAPTPEKVSGEEKIEDGAVRLFDGELIRTEEPMPGVTDEYGREVTPEEVLHSDE